MKTEDLIEALAREAAPPAPARHGWNTLIALLGGLGLALVVLVVSWGVRPDVVAAMPAVAAKAGFSALLAAAAAPLALRLARPGRPLGWRLGAAVLIIVGSLALAGVALLATPAGERWQALTGGGFPWCLAIIPLLAAPMAAGLMLVARALAPIRLDLAGAAIGAVAGGFGAMVYALHCPVDSVAFVATWYALAVALCAVAGAFIGRVFLRW